MSGLDFMKKRMLFEGGGRPTSDGRNVKGKLLSFRSALWNSYQAEDITFNGQKCRCLINPDKLKENYDHKTISIDFDYGMKPGDTFYWDRTESNWIVFLEEHCEEAYFRASIRRCDYKIDNDWVYLRGPVETALIWRQKHQIEFNELNYSILVYVTRTEENLKKFSRLNVIKFDGHNWRVAATDKYSQPGLIEVYLEEYHDNPMEDKMIVPEIIKPDAAAAHIEGLQIVKPFAEKLSYSIVGMSGGAFSVNSNKVKILSSDETRCILTVTSGKSGKFTVTYKKEGETDVSLDVIIKSL